MTQDSNKLARNKIMLFSNPHLAENFIWKMHYLCTYIIFSIYEQRKSYKVWIRTEWSRTSSFWRRHLIQASITWKLLAVALQIECTSVFLVIFVQPIEWSTGRIRSFWNSIRSSFYRSIKHQKVASDTYFYQASIWPKCSLKIHKEDLSFF